ncbi:MAG: DNA repair protein RadA [Patescibacteria group bacterium]
MHKGPVYTCAKCDAQFPKWAGRCTACGAWGSIGQTPTEGSESSPEQRGRVAAMPSKSASFKGEDGAVHAKMRQSGFAPLDATLGGGIVDGSVTLIAGEPGIGKSTLLAQLSLVRAANKDAVLYVTGEESPAQIRRRLDRLSKDVPESLHFLDRTDADVVAATIEAEGPALAIIDSIQTMRAPGVESEPGSATQVKASAAIIAEAAKRSHKAVIIVGQVTKDGDIAGPRLLEHLVDTVLFLEGDRMHRYRILRALKHRFGATDEVALLSMTEQGLIAVEDASTELLKDRASGVPGSSITCLIEGHRPMLLEVQALVSPAGYGTPIRRATGIDTARLGMLLAVLGRRAGVQTADKDVYANAAGGFDARDPSADLALATAIASAVKDAALDPRLLVFGEIGLAGELRPVALPEARLKEGARLGFTQALVPKGQGKNAPKGLLVKEAGTLREALQMIHVM